jgi:ABC-2 type transport system ATP-binding protein
MVQPRLTAPSGQGPGRYHVADVISVRGLRKRFGSVQAVAGVDLAVDSGEVLLLLGQNGAGKSTTLRCLGGILRPDEGEIALDDLRLPNDLDAVRTRLGVVPDLARLYGRNTAWEYLEHFGAIYGVPAAERHERIGALLERFELTDAADRVLSSYSRGMAQKVALIRATLHEPRWLFCDEPTVGLDPVAAADMRRYLGEQRDRGAAVIVTTHVLVEAELLADRVAIMRRGRVVADGSLSSLRRWAHPTRRFTAVLSAELANPKAILDWLRGHNAAPDISGRRLSYGVPWAWPDAELAEFAAELQRRLHREKAPYFELSEQQQSLENVYLKALAEATDEPAVASRTANIPGLRPGQVLGSLREQPRRLAQFLPFYLSSWWRRGDLSWVMYLNAFVLLLVGGVSLFGTAPGNLGLLAGRIPRGASLEAGLLLPLFFMSFALLESIKSSIGIWWEKAQQSLEVLLYTPLDDPSLIWLEVLPGVVVSGVYVTFWVAAGMTLMTIFGRPAPWDLLPAFAFVAVATAYWAAMGRLLGFMLFPREGAAGGAWSFLLSPVSAAVADLPLALFVFRSPLAFASLLLPLGACLALTIVTGATFDRERLMETGVGRERAKRRRWLPLEQVRRHLPALAAGVLLAILPALVGGALAAAAGVHSWPGVIAVFQGRHTLEPVTAAVPGVGATSGVAIAAAAMAGVVSGFALLLLLLAVTFAAFFLLGLPELLLLPAAAGLWGAEIGFGPQAPLQSWLGLAGGIVILALTINTAAGLPLYSALAFGAGSRVERLRAAWADYFALYRGLVIPVCAVFGIVVVALLITNT